MLRQLFCTLMRTGVSLAFLAAASCVSAQQVTLPLWPDGTPEASGVNVADTEISESGEPFVAGKPVTRIKNVSRPTLSVYPASKGTGASPAILVFPGGAYKRLAYDLEGTEVCAWLNSLGITCVVVKYRVPFEGHYPEVMEDLEDAQQAMRITRAHAAEWHIDPQRIGAMGFSAGAHLAVTLGNHPDFRREQAPENPLAKISALPNFVLVIYPGYLTAAPDLSKLAAPAAPNSSTPPTFLLQTEDDFAHVENSLLYYEALKEAKVKAELHVFAEGGHGYGLRPTEQAVTHWPALAERWLHTIQVLPGPAQ
jgi:acetyl esterase/lipase